MPVIDLTAIKSALEQLEVVKAQLDTALNTLGELQRHYAMLKGAYEALSHPTDINSVAYGLGMLSNVMPESDGLAEAVAGTARLAGQAGMLSDAFRTHNFPYIPMATDSASQRAWREATAVSNVAGIAQQNLAALEARAKLMPQIQARLDNAKDVQDTQAITARLVAEQNYVTLQAAQATNLQVLQQAQIQANEQSARLAERQSIAEADKTLCATLTGLGGSFSGNCNTKSVGGGV